MDKEIDKLKATGKVYLWEYSENDRNYPGWNMTVNNEAAQSLDKLLDLMDSSEFPSSKSIELTIPTQAQLNVPNNRKGEANFKTIKTLKLCFKKFDDQELWETKRNRNELEIRFGAKKLKEFRNAIMGIPKGEGDFAIADGQDESIVYFWWNLDK